MNRDYQIPGFLFNILIILVLPFVLFSQTKTTTYGNLLHINVHQEEIDVSDTLKSWTKIIDDINIDYRYDLPFLFEIKQNGKRYFIRSETWAQSTNGLTEYLLEDTADFSYRIGWSSHDNINPPLKFFKTTNGIFFFQQSNLFMDSTENMRYSRFNERLYLSNIAGKIDNSYICGLSGKATNSSKDDLYAIIDLEHYPDSDTTAVTWLKNNNYSINNIEEIGPNQFLFSGDAYNFECYLSAIQNDSVIVLKTFQNVGYRWTIKLPFIYALHNNNLKKFEFDFKDSTITYINDLLSFNNQENFPYERYFVDTNFEYAAYMENDSLFVFNIKGEFIENAWDISMLNGPVSPFINYPDVYVHQTLLITSLEEKTVLPEDFQISAYPNPFNSTITFEVNTSNMIIEELAIFNVMGQKVYKQSFASLQYRQKVNWNAMKESSGVYFARLRTNLDTRKRKIILLK